MILAHFIAYALGALLMSAAAVTAWTPRLRRLTSPLLATGLVVETVAIAMRWAVTGHPPVFGTFENTMAVTWFIAVAVLLCNRVATPEAQTVGRLLGLWIPAFVVFGLFFETTPYPLTISERSLWIDLHVLLAWSAFTVMLGTSMLALALVTRIGGLEPDRALDRAMYVSLAGGFVVFTAMIVVGSFYSYLLFADWYRWELVEAFAAAAWLGYASVMHAHRFFGWRGKQLAWAVLAVLPLLICVFWVWSIYAGTYHHFEIPALRAS